MDEVLAVLVLYKCKLEDSSSFRTLNLSLKDFGGKLDVLVYDNSPISLYNESDFYIGNIKVHYISDSLNPGVSKAYNVGADYAYSKGKKWVLLLDQDTCFPINAIAIYADYIKEGSALGAPILLSNDRCISPCFFRCGRGKALREYEIGMNEFRKISLLNSGLIIPLSLFTVSGGYNEKIALDFSDHYFIERLKKITSRYCLLEIECNHSLSASETDINKILNRFGYYLKGAKEYSNWKFSIVAFLRTIKLTLKFRDVRFFRKYVKEYLK